MIILKKYQYYKKMLFLTFFTIIIFSEVKAEVPSEIFDNKNVIELRNFTKAYGTDIVYLIKNEDKYQFITQNKTYTIGSDCNIYKDNITECDDGMFIYKKRRVIILKTIDIMTYNNITNELCFVFQIKNIPGFFNSDYYQFSYITPDVISEPIEFNFIILYVMIAMTIISCLCSFSYVYYIQKTKKYYDSVSLYEQNNGIYQDTIV